MRSELALHQITCGFCNERGRLHVSKHFEHKKDHKVLNYDICQCAQCGNYTMAFWSASSSAVHVEHTIT